MVQKYGYSIYTYFPLFGKIFLKIDIVICELAITLGDGNAAIEQSDEWRQLYQKSIADCKDYDYTKNYVTDQKCVIRITVLN